MKSTFIVLTAAALFVGHGCFAKDRDHERRGNKDKPPAEAPVDTGYRTPGGPVDYNTLPKTQAQREAEQRKAEEAARKKK